MFNDGDQICNQADVSPPFPEITWPALEVQIVETEVSGAAIFDQIYSFLESRFAQISCLLSCQT